MRDCKSVYRVGAGIMSRIVLWDTLPLISMCYFKSSKILSVSIYSNVNRYS